MTPKLKIPYPERVARARRPAGMQDALLCYPVVMGYIALWGTFEGAKAAVCWDDKTVVPAKLIYYTPEACWAIELDDETSTEYDMHPLYDLKGDEI